MQVVQLENSYRYQVRVLFPPSPIHFYNLVGSLRAVKKMAVQSDPEIGVTRNGWQNRAFYVHRIENKWK